MTNPINQILQGDALTKLKELESESVDCIITSPPYWALRDYKTEGTIWDETKDCEHDFSLNHRRKSAGGTASAQVGNHMKDEIAHFDVTTNSCSKCNAWKGELGQEPTIDLYINHLIQIFNEAKRVLKKTGTCWVVLGDTYSSQGGFSKPEHLLKANVGATKSGEQRGTRYFSKNLDIPEKSLCMIPERFAIKMIDNNWVLRNKIIWHKRNCMPSSAKDRFTIDYEYIYFFTKSQKYYFKTQYEPYNGNESGWTKQRQKGINNIVYQKKEMVNGWGNPNIELNPNGRIKRCIWTINTKPFSEAHFAVFPEELVKQCLDAGCPPEGTVLDMFMGSGTTAKVALQNNRRFLGIEISQPYINIAMKRLERYLYEGKLTNYIKVEQKSQEV